MYILIFALSLGVLTFLILYSGINKILTHLKHRAIDVRLGIIKKRSADKHQIVIGGLLGMTFGIMLSWGTSHVVICGLIFSGLGIGSVVILQAFSKNRITALKKAECLVLFESTEIFLRAGMSLQTSLANSKMLTKLLNPAIDAALAAWPAGSIQALEILRKEVALPEGDILVSLLMQLNQAGTANFEGIIQRESQRIEAMRFAVEKAQIARKPLILVVYRSLPMFIVLGLFIGALTLRAFAQMPFLHY